MARTDRTPSSAVAAGQAPPDRPTDRSAELAASLAGVVGRQVPGLSVAVVDPDGVRWTAALGVADRASGRPATAATVYLWFSMTKIATATAALQLADAGALDLDAPAAELVPALAAARAHGVPARITCRQLLSHTSGLVNPIPVGWVHPADSPGPDPAAFADRLLARHTRLAFAPGTRTAYSNLGYLALGRAIEAASGQSFDDYLRGRVLQPLGMRDTDFAHSAATRRVAATGYQPRWSPLTLLLPFMLPTGILGPASGRYVAFRPFYVDGPAYGGLVGSAPDAARLATLHLNDGLAGGTRLLSAEAAVAMRRLAATGPDLDVGLGWFRRRADARRGETFVEHLGGGAGFFNLMRLYPERALAVVVMGNATGYDQARVVAAVLAAAAA